MENAMTVARRLADFIRALERVPQSAEQAAQRALFDAVGCAAAGASTSTGRAACQAAKALWGEGRAPVWFGDLKLTGAGAAFVNAAYCSALDLDDGHRAAAGHPGAAIVPAVLAAAGTLRPAPSRLLSAIAIGYEVGVRVGAARDFSTLATTDTGRWCAYGVAAALGWLHGLPAETIAHAMAIAGTTSPQQSATAWTRHMGNSVKEGIPWGTATGFAGVELAAAGYSGPVDLLDDPARYQPARLIADLGNSWAIEGAYQKIYSCCRWAHAPVDAVLRLQQDHAIDPDSIEAVEVRTFARAMTLNNEAAPATLESAQYSIPFCVALALSRGAAALLPIDAEALGDRAVIALARRVRLCVDDDIDCAFPAVAGARVSVEAVGSVHRATVLQPLGEPSNPLSATEADAKFARLADRSLDVPAALRLKRAVQSLHDALTIDSLLAALVVGSAGDEGLDAGRLPSATSERAPLHI
jgi:2-methylcitrate dehydratase PrpD